jgi:hypothetical protein
MIANPSLSPPGVPISLIVQPNGTLGVDTAVSVDDEDGNHFGDLSFAAGTIAAQVLTCNRPLLTPGNPLDGVSTRVYANPSPPLGSPPMVRPFLELLYWTDVRQVIDMTHLWFAYGPNFTLVDVAGMSGEYGYNYAEYYVDRDAVTLTPNFQCPAGGTLAVTATAGTLSTAAPVDGVPFTITPPAAGSGSLAVLLTSSNGGRITAAVFYGKCDTPAAAIIKAGMVVGNTVGTFGGEPVPAAPRIPGNAYPASNRFRGSVRVSITGITPGAAVFLTLDDGAPVKGISTPYAGPFVLTASARVRAVAVRNGVYSPVTVADYVKVD